MLKVLRSITRFCNTFLGYCAGFGIFAMGLILAYEVVMRGIFKSPTIWVMDTAIYLFMWTMLIGSAYTLMLGKHVKIDLIFDRFPKKMQLVLDVITSAMAAYFCYIIHRCIRIFNHIFLCIRYAIGGKHRLEGHSILLVYKC